MKLPASDYTRMLQALVETAQIVTRDGVQLGTNTGCDEAVRMLLALHAADRKAMVIGNGGSAAIASHMVNDLSKSANLRAMAFNDFSLITALANDDGYEHAYETCVQQWAQADDVLIAISSSGKSKNMLLAVAAAQAAGARVITLTGFRSDNPLRRLGDLNIHIAAEDYGMVELAHSILTHYLTDTAAAARAQKATKNATKENQHDITVIKDIADKTTRADHRRSGIRRGRASA